MNAKSTQSLAVKARRIALRIVFGFIALQQCSPRLAANIIFVHGNLRTDATVTDCGSGCTLGPANSDGDYAQWAAAVQSFVVNTTTTMDAITYGYGGGTSLTGPAVPAGGLEPYLSLFDASGDFLASTFGPPSGTTCPPGANTVGGNCFDVSLNGGTLTPGTYFIALTAFENQSLAENPGGFKLSDGFTGLGNLSAGENLNYAFDIILPSNVVPTNTPEPGAMTLWLIGAAALFVPKLHQSKKTNWRNQ